MGVDLIELIPLLSFSDITPPVAALQVAQKMWSLVPFLKIYRISRRDKITFQKRIKKEGAKMQTIEEIAKTLDIDPVELEKESLRCFLQKEIRNLEVEIYRIGNKHGVKSVLELDEKLKKGEIKEEEMLDDFMELEFLETKREKLLKALEKVK